MIFYSLKFIKRHPLVLNLKNFANGEIWGYFYIQCLIIRIVLAEPWLQTYGSNSNLILFIENQLVIDLLNNTDWILDFKSQ